MAWFRRRKKKEDLKNVYAKSQDSVLVTTETELELKKCKILDDSKLEFPTEGWRNKKTVRIMPGRDAHTFRIHRSMLPVSWLRLFIAKVPKWLLFRVYTARKEGEITHDPNKDQLDPGLKTQFEEALKIIAIGGKAEWGKAITEGLKDTQPWWEKLGGLIAVTVVVFLFLFAFQIQPNL